MALRMPQGAGAAALLVVAACLLAAQCAGVRAQGGDYSTLGDILHWYTRNAKTHSHLLK